ncbi:heme o synthase [Allobacillus sp. GCM10007491]|uniref:Protoheme IX farnesyltransferase n=1 Tax=Allobacillus saliphilus TaxID=2912308 RepID=A0A941CWQ2_9BACI|nr:heme o synthase [Allobacillus saliphilus]MBR7554026.1 heme o synthase [Allobacillus saliphilus]
MKNVTIQSSRDSSSLVSLLIDIKNLLKGKVLIANVFPVFTAFWLALYFQGEQFSGHIGLFFLTLIGSTLVISGALMLNNWFEVDLDQNMDRTQERPTVSGNFSLRAVLLAGIVTTIVGLAIMFFTTNEALLYSFLGWFVYVVLYTFWSKRKYAWNTLIGSVSGAFTPLIGWAAIAPANHVVPITLFVILLIWQVPHTLAITIRRLEDYTRAGVPMLPVVRGVQVAMMHHLIYVIALLPLPFLLIKPLGWIFFVIAILLTISWMIHAVKGFQAKDQKKWAQTSLRFSLIYLILLFLLMVILTI